MSDEQARSPSLALVLRTAIERRLKELHVALPGRVERYDKDKQVADVQPLVRFRAELEDGDVELETLPVISSVPVQWPAAGGMRLVLPLKQGDTGWIMFSEASLDVWQAQGGLVDPADDRRFHIADATFLPGLHANDKPLTVEGGDDASFGKDGAHQVVVTNDGIELGGNGNDRPSDHVALATPSKNELQKLHDTLQSFVNTFNLHTHQVATSGTATAQSGTAAPTTSQAVGPQSVGDVASAKVKSK